MQIQSSRDVVVLANRKDMQEEKCKCIPVYSSSASTFRDVRSHQSAHPGRTTQATIIERRRTEVIWRQKKKKRRSSRTEGTWVV